MSITTRYINKVKINCTNLNANDWDLDFWRNKLFYTTIVYVLPLSLIALVPGLYWILKIKHYPLALVDVLAVISIIGIAFLPSLTLIVRKVIFITCSYIFSFAILYYVGLNGPGLIYLLTASIFSVLIFSTPYVYWSAWVNTLVCMLYAVLMHFQWLPSEDNRGHHIGEWTAISANLIFLSFLCAALIPRLFRGLQKTIEKEVQLKMVLESERTALDSTSQALSYALNDIRKTMDSSLDVICAIDAGGRFIRVSAACEDVWGYKADELIGKYTIDFVCAEDYVKTKEASDKVLAGINAVNFENRYVHKNGSLIPISWTARWDEKDQVRYSVARDITEKKILEKPR